jgi:hypothetical protein
VIYHTFLLAGLQSPNPDAEQIVQEGAGFPDFALDLANPDFVKYAEAYGAKGYRIREVRRPHLFEQPRSLDAVPVCYEMWS